MKIKTKIKCACGELTEAICKKPHAIEPSVGSVNCSKCDSLITFRVTKGDSKFKANIEYLSVKVTEKCIKLIRVNHFQKKAGMAFSKVSDPEKVPE